MLVIGHRGARGEKPENSITALRTGIESGADAIEFDIRVTRDGIPILSHDYLMYRTHHKIDFISRHSLSELTKKTAGSDHHVMTLEAALNECLGKTMLIIDMKEYRAVTPVVTLLKKYFKRKKDWEAVVFSSFNPLIVDTTEGKVRAGAVLIATGSDYKKIGVPGEAEYYGRGVHYCATCDGAFYRDKKLVVVGGGNSAVQEALFLTRFTTHIDLLVRSKLRASEVLQKELDEAVKAGKITVHLETTTDEIVAENNSVTKVIGTHDGQKVEFPCDGVFVFVGLLPNTQFLSGSAIELDEVGLIKTGMNLETSLPGVFASGDVRSGATMQIASAVGEGATAALKIREYLEEQARKTALV